MWYWEPFEATPHPPLIELIAKYEFQFKRPVFIFVFFCGSVKYDTSAHNAAKQFWVTETLAKLRDF